MDIRKRPNRWLTRYSRAWERKFFFYATLAMLILWGVLGLLGYQT